jgi:hypothetical protein
VVGPRNAADFLPDLPRSPGLLLPILIALASSPSSSFVSSSPTSGAPPPLHAACLGARPAYASSPPPTHQHRRIVLLPLPSASQLSFPTPIGAWPPPPPGCRRTPALPGCPPSLIGSC